MNFIKAKKHLGQNFLTNQVSLQKITETANLNENDLVLEVGPGTGILTKELVKKAGQVISIEKDHDLLPALNQKFKDAKNLRLIEGDILSTKLPEEDYKVVANIPYYISSPILKLFLFAKHKPSELTILVQKEVAEKICSPENDNSILSMQVKLFGTPQIMATVPKNHFTPAPKVDSSILHIKVFQKDTYKNPEKILQLAKLAFSQKRKKIKNTLLKHLKMSATEFQEKTGIDPERRPETILLNEWEQIAAKL